MTLEQFLVGKTIVEDIERQNDRVRFLEKILEKDVTGWIVEIRPSRLHTPYTFDHCGLLRSFLEEILEAERKTLKEAEEELKAL